MIANFARTTFLLLTLTLCACGGREPRTDDGYRYFKYSHAPRDDWKTGHDYADWIHSQGADPAQVLRPRKGTPGGLVAPTGPAPEQDNVPPPLHQTTWSTEMALEFIADPSRRPDQPWLLSVNPYYPHPPFNPPWEYYRRFDPESLPGPHVRESDLALVREDESKSPCRPMASAPERRTLDQS